MEQHLTSQDLAAFAKGELPREAARAVIAHLLGGCTACRSESASRWHLGRSQEPLPEDAYDAGFDRVLALVRGGREQGPEQVTTLLQRAWELRHDSPEETRRTSRMAVLAADALDAGRYGAPEVADLRGRAWAGYGNACRIAGDLDEARRALERAAETLTQGTGDLGDRARLYEFQASLEVARGSSTSSGSRGGSRRACATRPGASTTSRPPSWGSPPPAASSRPPTSSSTRPPSTSGGAIRRGRWPWCAPPRRRSSSSRRRRAR